MNIHTPPKNIDETIKLLDLVMKQQREVIKIKETIKCICGKNVKITNVYHCWFCGLYLCPICARKHFGEKPKGLIMKQLEDNILKENKTI